MSDDNCINTRQYYIINRKMYFSSLKLICLIDQTAFSYPKNSIVWEQV